MWFPLLMCFQFSIRMLANLTYSERGYFEKLAAIISVVSMYSVCKGLECEG